MEPRPLDPKVRAEIEEMTQQAESHTWANPLSVNAADLRAILAAEQYERKRADEAER